MNCPECQVENQDGSKFCCECGHNLPLLSTTISQVISFDEKLEKIQRYLPQGLTEKILNQKDKIEGERKQVTVMFCDMEKFTSLVDRVGSEETYGIMDKVYEILIHNVHDFGGTVNEMTGDGIMALFGAPIALEDAPHRALWSALSIHREIARFSEQKKGIGPIKMRIGIHTGPVVVGTLGNDLRVEFKAVGDTVNLASRMEKFAEAGYTYLTEETFRMTKGLFQFEAIGKKAIKGRKQTVPIYKVLSHKPDVYRPRLGSERKIFSELVGREKELNELELQVLKTINGEGSVVNLIGEAGIGKSRLLAELKKCEVVNKVSFLEGRAISIGRNLSFHPIIDLLKQWARIREDDGEASALGKLETAVRRICSEDFHEILPFVAILMGMRLSGRYKDRVAGIEGESLEKLILKNFRALLIRATHLTPLVIVLEDLHWADTTSIVLIESLFRLAETERILFINVFRKGHKEVGDHIAEITKNRVPNCHVEIELEPLDDKMSEKLITNMLNVDDLHHPIIAQIVQRTGGNPLFIEEIVRSWIDQRAIVPIGGAFQMTDRIGTIAIPNNINDVLMARIDRLDEGTRELLKIASVIGRAFFYRVLVKVANTVDDIESRLSHLKQIQLLRKGQRLGEVEYLFNHALAQEAAYDSILPIKRKRLHLKVADSIENVFDERLHEFYGMLAYHYSRGESLERAEEYLIKAGEEALKSSASNEALYYYQEALGIYLSLRGSGVDPEKVAILEKNIGLALFNRGHYAEAVEHFDKALNYYWGELPKNALSTALRFVSSFITFILALYFPSRWFRGLPTQLDTEAIDLFYKKAEALVVINPKRFFIEIFFVCGTIVHFDLTKFKFGIATFVGSSAIFSFTGLSFSIGRRILDYVEPRLAPDDAKQCLIYDFFDTLHHFLKGRWNEIAECDEELVNRNLKLGESFYASQHYYWHGLPKIYQGHFDAARLMVTKLSEIAEAYENDIYRLLKYLLNVNLLIECRRLNEATDEVKRGIDHVQRKGWSLSLLSLLSLEASIHLLTNELEKAEKSLDKADQIRSEVKAVPLQLSFFYRSQFEYYLRRLEAHFRSGRREESSKYRRNAFKSGKMLIKTCRKAALFRTESCRLMGVYHWLIDNEKTSLEYWRMAIDEGERLNARPQLSRTYAEMARRFYGVKADSKLPSSVHIDEFIKKAKTMFDDLGLNQDYEELDSVMGGTEERPSDL